MFLLIGASVQPNTLFIYINLSLLVYKLNPLITQVLFNDVKVTYRDRLIQSDHCIN